MRKLKVPTCTFTVENMLRELDDFATREDIIALTGESPNRVSAALHHLRKYKVIDVIIQPDGRGWWFVLPEISDQRSVVKEEITPETRPRKPRRARKPVVSRAE